MENIKPKLKTTLLSNLFIIILYITVVLQTFQEHPTPHLFTIQTFLFIILFCLLIKDL